MNKEKRAIRRHHDRRIKSKMRRLISTYFVSSPKWKMKMLNDDRFIGHLATTHGRPCSCSMCSSEGYTISDLRKNDHAEVQISEIYSREED
jgi:hypothetical protein